MPFLRARAATRHAPGRDVARLLAGAWRADAGPPAFSPGDLPSALERAEAVLLGAGCGAFVWRRLREEERRELPAARAYRDAFRHHAIEAEVARRRIALAVATLRAARVEPLLLKGWSTARRYAEPRLRPFGDIDLCVRPSERAAAERAFAGATGEVALAHASLDLHTSVDDLADRPLDELTARSELAQLGDAAATRVAVLSVEDHLRHLALHLLRHGAWRPLWLCDVAVLVESHGESLDWDRCLRGTRDGARRVAYVLGLARQLLGARLPRALPGPAARAAAALPRWLVAATLDQWGTPYRRYTGEPLAGSMTSRTTIARAMAVRWPNPIEATVSVGAPFNRFPRLPIQLGDVTSRAGRALAAGLRTRR